MIISFNEELHKYTLDEAPDKVLTSVSKVFDHYKTPFERVKVAQAYLTKGDDYVLTDLSKKWKLSKSEFIAKHGNPANYDVIDILNLWDLKSKIALTKGTCFHKLMEDEGLSKGCLKGYSKDEKSHRSLDVTNLQPGTYLELIIPHLSAWLVGTADKVIIHDNKEFTLRDYKTDVKMEFKATAYFNKLKGIKEAKKLKVPLSHIDDVNGQNYNIKMSMYVYFLECLGYTFKEGWIDHALMENITIEDLKDGKLPEIVSYPMTYYKKEVQALINHFKLQHK